MQRDVAVEKPVNSTSRRNKNESEQFVDQLQVGT